MKNKTIQLRRAIKIVFIPVFLMISSFSLQAEAASEDYSEKEIEVFDALSKMSWDVSTYRLKNSHSTISIPEGYGILTEADARSFFKLIQGVDGPNIEAIIIDPTGVHSIYFLHAKAGYVSIDDWEQINPKELLHTIREGTEADNKERIKKGISPIHTIGWVQEPVLDKRTNTVYWAIESDCEGERIVNSTALRLGRNGYESIKWICDRDLYKPFGGELDVMLRSHSFDPGYRYSDFSKGDRVAEYGVTALVAGAIGGKIVKAGGIALLLKKFGGFLIAGVLVFFRKIKNFFLGRNKHNSCDID